MNRPASLRWGVLLGALLWTVGLFVLAGVVATWFVFSYPSGPRILHTPFLNVGPSLVTAAICMAAGLYFVRSGLSAMRRLRDQVAQVRTGEQARIRGTYPSEVTPLVDDLNALLDHQDAAVRRAHARAADLAHGLKTSLAVVAYEAERAGATERGDVLRAQVDRMQRQIDYHLAHARAAASGATPGTSSEVGPAVDALVRTVSRLHATRGVAIRSHVAPGASVRAQREDLEEMLGNLLDNACKWAKSQVRVSLELLPAEPLRPVYWLVQIEDDGPGWRAGDPTSLFARGARADESAPGHGLGLSIVQELVDAYDSEIRAARGELGGARIEVRLPAAQERRGKPG